MLVRVRRPPSQRLAEQLSARPRSLNLEDCSKVKTALPSCHWTNVEINPIHRISGGRISIVERCRGRDVTIITTGEWLSSC